MAERDYSKLDKAELIKIVEKLESRKKYGLIWDEEKVKEQFEKDAENALPVLSEVKSKEIVDGNHSKPINFIIEGDNYHALSVLNFTHQKKIDVIYIDPPYNTGDTSWKYNNDFVEKEDTYRHSKWLSFMNKRLLLARNLLTERGVLVCTIDDNEFTRLGLLLEEIFPSHQITCVTIVHNPAGIQGNNFSYTHEYAYFVYPKAGQSIGLQDRDDDPDIRPLRNVSAGEVLRDTAANCFYPIFVRDNKIIGFGDVCPDSFHPRSANILRKDGVIEIYPIDPQGQERKWVFARQSVEKIVDELTVEFNKKRKILDVIRRKSKFPFRTVWTGSKYSANNNGTQLLNQIIKPDSFSYPKSIYAVIDCIKAASNENKSVIVLDFFAGSGTTGHAVMEMNKEDGGNRSFILCTNNENKIAEKVCYPRIKNVISGYKNLKNHNHVSGVGGSLKYFTTRFVKKTNNSDDFKARITNECTEMLCLREGVFSEVKKTANYRIFKHGAKTVAVYYSLERESLPVLKKELEKINGEKTLYCFTLDPSGLSKTEFANWRGIKLEPIPQKILDVYKQIYEY